MPHTSFLLRHLKELNMSFGVILDWYGQK